MDRTSIITTVRNDHPRCESLNKVANTIAYVANWKFKTLVEKTDTLRFKLLAN